MGIDIIGIVGLLVHLNEPFQLISIKKYQHTNVGLGRILSKKRKEKKKQSVSCVIIPMTHIS